MRVPHQYRIAILTVDYDKNGSHVHEEYEVTSDFVDDTLRMPSMAPGRRLAFKEAVSLITAFVSQPVSRVESRMKCTGLRINLLVDGHGVSRRDSVEGEVLLRILSFAYSRIEEATASRRRNLLEA